MKNNHISFCYWWHCIHMFFRFRMDLSMWFVECWLHTSWTLLSEFYFGLYKAWFEYVTSGQNLLIYVLLSGWSIVSDAWEPRAFGNDGQGVGTSARAYDSKGWVSSEILCQFSPWWMLHCMYKSTCFASTNLFWWFINAYPRRSLALIEK